MALLTLDDLAEQRRAVAQGTLSVTWTKPQINAALQAIEDRFEANAASLATAMNAATAPLVFTAPQKKRCVAAWLHSRLQRE